MKPICTVTLSPAIDVSTAVDRIVPEDKLRCDELRIEPGGGGVNVARALRELGVVATAIFPTSGFLGGFYQSLLEDLGIPCRTFETKVPLRRLSTNVYERDRDRQFRFVPPGAEIREEEWQQALDLVRSSSGRDGIIVMSGTLPPGTPGDLPHRFAEVAAETGSILVLDSPGSALETGTEAPLDWIVPNEREFEELLGSPIGDQSLPELLRSFVQENRIQNALLTMGSEGALYAGQEKTIRIPAPAVEKRSAVGAGDSLSAGLVYGLAGEAELEETLRFAVAAGSAAAMTPGSSLLRREDFDALLKEIRLSPTQGS